MAQLSEISEWVSAFRTLRKRYPSRDEIVNWVCQQGVEDGKANKPDSPPCPRCGQPMVDRDMGEPEEYCCKPCNFALVPLAMMRGENKGKLLFSMTEPKYAPDDLPHFEELFQWVKRNVIESQ